MAVWIFVFIVKCSRENARILNSLFDLNFGIARLILLCISSFLKWQRDFFLPFPRLCQKFLRIDKLRDLVPLLRWLSLNNNTEICHNPCSCLFGWDFVLNVEAKLRAEKWPIDCHFNILHWPKFTAHRYPGGMMSRVWRLSHIVFL